MGSTRNLSLRERLNISRLAIAYPWLTLGFWLAVSVAGVLAFSSLKYALFPDITFPVVVVTASAPLRTALDTEAKLTQLLEQPLSALVDDFRSSTYPGQTVISLSFPVGANLEASSLKVEAALKSVVLPAGAALKVTGLNLNESSAVSYAIESSTQNLSQLTKLAQDQILPSVSRVPGVLRVVLLGASADSRSFPAGRPPSEQSSTQSAVRFNGKEALAFEVIKRGNANTLEVVSQVEKEAARLRSVLPVQLNLAATQAEYIREATQATIDALLLAVVLAVVVIFPFLKNWQATLISALAIPTSLLGTFIVMAACGFNLETITMLALVLVIGIIIDDAIVDVENIARHIEAGESPRKAAISATNEIGLTVTAATFTIVAVFLPVGLMGGVVGQFFKPFGLTISAAVIASLLVARTLSPLLASKWLKPKAVSDKGQWTGVYKRYRNTLSWSLKHRRIVLGLALLSLVVGIELIPLIPKGFIPKLDRGEFNIVYTSAADTPLSQSLSYAQMLEKPVLSSPQVQAVFTTVGASQGEPNKGNLYVKLRRDRTIRTPELQDQLRRLLPTISGVTTSVEDIKFVDTGDEKPFQVALLGDNLAALDRTAQQLKERIQHLPGFVDVTATGVGRGLNSNPTPNGIFEVEHLNRRRVAYVSANLDQNLTLGQATDRVVKEAKTLLPAGISLSLGGDSARSGEVFGSFGTTLGLSVLCILVVLVLLFQSWVAPLVIICALPLALVGAVIALFVTRSELGMISVIGIIFLLGLTNKNAIIIVDYINQLRHTGLSRTEAILQAAPLRLRPILMTTAAAILGMLPIALGLGAGSELRSPMAITIIGGLVASTLLSLVVVPVTYALLDDWWLFVFQRKRSV